MSLFGKKLGGSLVERLFIERANDRDFGEGVNP
jgi:hypothetical protein